MGGLAVRTGRGEMSFAVRVQKTLTKQACKVYSLPLTSDPHPASILVHVLCIYQGVDNPWVNCEIILQYSCENDVSSVK